MILAEAVLVESTNKLVRLYTIDSKSYDTMGPCSVGLDKPHNQISCNLLGPEVTGIL